MVRLRLTGLGGDLQRFFKFQSHYGAIATLLFVPLQSRIGGFNPTMVRLRLVG